MSFFTQSTASAIQARTARKPNLGKFNLPNVITYLRIILTTIIIVVGKWNHGIFLMFPMIVIAGVTDKIDGYLARKRGEVTYFGAGIDRGADKYFVLVVSWLMWTTLEAAYSILPTALMSFALEELKILVSIEVALIIFGFLGALMGWPIESSFGGKWKMVTQCVIASWWSLFFYAIAPLFGLTLNSGIFLIPFVILLTVSNILAAISGWGYLKAYLPLIWKLIGGK